MPILCPIGAVLVVFGAALRQHYKRRQRDELVLILAIGYLAVGLCCAYSGLNQDHAYWFYSEPADAFAFAGWGVVLILLVLLGIERIL